MKAFLPKPITRLKPYDFDPSKVQDSKEDLCDELALVDSELGKTGHADKHLETNAF